MKKILAVVALVLVAAVSGCSTDAQVASYNLSKEADMFRIERRVVFINGITGDYMLSIQGLCSIQDQATQLEVTCKVGQNEYKKHFLGLSDNVSYIAEQLDPVAVSEYRYKVIFKPATILPDVEMKL